MQKLFLSMSFLCLQMETVCESHTVTNSIGNFDNIQTRIEQRTIFDYAILFVFFYFLE